MRLFFLKFSIIFFIVVINNNIYAFDSTLWVELQQDWYSIENVEIKDFESFVENKADLYKVDIFYVLKQYETSIKNDSIRVYKTIGKIDKIIELFIYVRSVIPMVSVEFNGRNLEFNKPTWNEYLFKIDYSMWEDNNLITIIVPTLGDLPKQNLMPAVFIVKENSIDRIRNLIVNVPPEKTVSKMDVSLKGPILLKKLDDQEYKLFTSNPGFYTFNENTFWRTIFPSDFRHLLKNSTVHKLSYKFYFKLNLLEKRDIFLSIGAINGADEVYINNKLVGKTGILGILSQSFYDKKRNYLIPYEILKKNDVNEFLIITHGLADYASGVIQSNDIKLKNRSMNFNIDEIIDLVIIFILVMTSLSSIIISFFLKNRRGYILQALFLMNSALYLFFNSQVEYFISDNFLFRKKGEFIFLFLQMPFTCLFFRFIYASKFSIFEKLINAIMYINLIFQVVLLFVPILSNDISLYHNCFKYLYVSWTISFSYIFLLTLRDVFYYYISGLELSLQKIDLFLKSARATWNEKMKFIPGRLYGLFNVEISPFAKIIMKSKRESVIFLILLIIFIGGLCNDYLIDQRVSSGVKLFKYIILLFCVTMIALSSGRFIGFLKHRRK